MKGRAARSPGEFGLDGEHIARRRRCAAPGPRNPDCEYAARADNAPISRVAAADWPSSRSLPCCRDSVVRYVSSGSRSVSVASACSVSPAWATGRRRRAGVTGQPVAQRVHRRHAGTQRGDLVLGVLQGERLPQQRRHASTRQRQRRAGRAGEPHQPPRPRRPRRVAPGRAECGAGWPSGSAGLPAPPGASPARRNAASTGATRRFRHHRQLDQQQPRGRGRAAAVRQSQNTSSGAERRQPVHLDAQRGPQPLFGGQRQARPRAPAPAARPATAPPARAAPPPEPARRWPRRPARNARPEPPRRAGAGSGRASVDAGRQGHPPAPPAAHPAAVLRTGLRLALRTRARSGPARRAARPTTSEELSQHERVQPACCPKVE